MVVWSSPSRTSVLTRIGFGLELYVVLFRDFLYFFSTASKPRQPSTSTRWSIIQQKRSFSSHPPHPPALIMVLGPPRSTRNVNDPIPLWEVIEKRAASEQSSNQERSSTTALFIGAKKAGKTTLIERFINPNKEDPPKPTSALDYKFVR